MSSQDSSPTKNLEADLAVAVVSEGMRTPASGISNLENVGLSTKKELNTENAFFKYIHSAVITYFDFAKDPNDHLNKAIETYL